MSKIPFSTYDFFGYLASGTIVLTAVDTVAGTGFLAGEWTVADSVLAVIGVYVAGHAVAQISSLALEHIVVRRLLGSPDEYLLSDDPPWMRSKFFPGHYKSLPAETVIRLEQMKAKRDAPEASRAFFFHAHSFAKNHSVVQDRLAVFLNLYGFARNMAFALLIASGLLFYEALADNGGQLWWALVVLGGAVTMFYRYLKFFRAYTAEVFLTYAEGRSGSPGEKE